MSPRQEKVIAFLGVVFTTHVAAQDPFTFCKDDTCGDCPVSVTSIGTGFPDCAIYNSADVFGNQGFPTSASDISAFLDVPQQDADQPCYLIFKSPANLEEPGCGKIQKSFQTATCGSITVEESFMVQFCCGREDCAAAGIIGISRRDDDDNPTSDSIVQSASGGGVRSLRLAVNGTEIKPAYVGTPKVAKSRRRKAVSLPRADGICDGDWVPLPGREDYTRPADGPQIVSEHLQGPVDAQIVKTRTSTWSTTIESSIGFADVLSLGISFSEEISESESTSEAATFPVPANTRGYVVWTSYLRCTEGSGHCDGEEVSGEVCTPYLDRNSGRLAGIYSLVEQG